MRKALLCVLISSLLTAFACSFNGNIPAALAASSVYQGNLVLNDDNITTIQGRFDINGSIVVEGNATLVLRNAVVNFTQATSRQYNLTLRNPTGGNPRLLAYNSTIQSVAPGLDLLTYVMANSTCKINNSTITSYILALDTSTLTITNSSYVSTQYGYGSAHIMVSNSTVREWHNYYSPTAEVEDSTLNSLLVGPRSANCTIRGLKPGLFKNWNFIKNCSATISGGGSTPNVTLTNTTVNYWRLAFYDVSNASIIDSKVGEASAVAGFSNINLKSSTCNYMYADNFATVQAENSTISTLQMLESAKASIDHSSVNTLQTRDSSSVWLNTTSATTISNYNASRTWLLNSTYTSLNVLDSASAYIAWYLRVHVVDIMGQNVYSANVTAQYLNSTIAARSQTGANGTAVLVLAEKIVNATAAYAIGNYTVAAAYQIYSNETAVNMTMNQQLTLTLGFIVPEYVPLLLAMALGIATLSTLVLIKKKSSRPHAKTS